MLSFEFRVRHRSAELLCDVGHERKHTGPGARIIQHISASAEFPQPQQRALSFVRLAAHQQRRSGPGWNHDGDQHADDRRRCGSDEFDGGRGDSWKWGGITNIPPSALTASPTNFPNGFATDNAYGTNTVSASNLIGRVVFTFSDGSTQTNAANAVGITNYVNTATNGLVTGSVTNGLATIAYATGIGNSSTNLQNSYSNFVASAFSISANGSMTIKTQILSSSGLKGKPSYSFSSSPTAGGYYDVPSGSVSFSVNSHPTLSIFDEILHTSGFISFTTSGLDSTGGSDWSISRYNAGTAIITGTENQNGAANLITSGWQYIVGIALTNQGGLYLGIIVTNGNYTMSRSNSVVVEIATTNSQINLPFIDAAGLAAQELTVVNQGGGNTTINSGITNTIGLPGITNIILSPGNSWSLYSLPGFTNWMIVGNTNGLATISYVNGATNGLVTASVTNGLATTNYVMSQLAAAGGTNFAAMNETNALLIWPGGPAAPGVGTSNVMVFRQSVNGFGNTANQNTIPMLILSNNADFAIGTEMVQGGVQMDVKPVNGGNNGTVGAEYDVNFSHRNNNPANTADDNLEVDFWLGNKTSNQGFTIFKQHGPNDASFPSQLDLGQPNNTPVFAYLFHSTTIDAQSASATNITDANWVPSNNNDPGFSGGFWGPYGNSGRSTNAIPYYLTNAGPQMTILTASGEVALITDTVLASQASFVSLWLGGDLTVGNPTNCCIGQNPPQMVSYMPLFLSNTVSISGPFIATAGKQGHLKSVNGNYTILLSDNVVAETSSTNATVTFTTTAPSGLEINLTIEGSGTNYTVVGGGSGGWFWLGGTNTASPTLTTGQYHFIADSTGTNWHAY